MRRKEAPRRAAARREVTRHKQVSATVDGSVIRSVDATADAYGTQEHS